MQEKRTRRVQRPRRFVERVEKIEKVKNSLPAREIEITLPAELTELQNRSLIRAYAKLNNETVNRRVMCSQRFLRLAEVCESCI
ncbi:MAG: MobA/MobL family protein [Peptococcaceae bacterium]|nr:MobA/MobL family protein [Peptococcaceae bacterium]